MFFANGSSAGLDGLPPKILNNFTDKSNEKKDKNFSEP